MMMLIKTIFLLYVLSFSALAHTSIQLKEQLSGKEKVTLKVAIEETGYFPFNYTEKGEVKGFSIDIIEYFRANSNYDFEFVTLPWPRALYLVAQGKVDIILTLFKTPKREKIYHFIEPFYGYEVNQLFTLAETNLEFTGQLQQLTPYAIGTLREYSYGKAFDQANYLKKYPALTEPLLLKLLLSRRVEVIIANPLAFNKLATQEKVSSQVKALEPYIATTPVYMALAKGKENSQEIKQTLEQLTYQLKASPYYQELLDKYQLNFQQ